MKMDFLHLFYFLLFSSLISFSESSCKLPHFAVNLAKEVGLAPIEGKPVRGLYPEDTTLEFQCKKGFVSIGGDQFITCFENTWKVFDEVGVKPARPLRCTKKPCPLKHPVNGNANLAEEKITYTCKKGFRLKGHKQARCMTDKDGNYYVPLDPPKCEAIARCPKAENSLLLYSGEDCCLGGNWYHLSCPKSHFLQGNSSLKCNMAGKWGAALPTCQEKARCAKTNIPSLIYEKYCCYAGFVYNFSCKPGSTLVGSSSLKCNDNGDWSNILPFCKAITTCSDPGETKFGNRSGICCNEDTILSYKCDKGYELLNKSRGNAIKCLPDGNWNGSKPLCIPRETDVCPPPPDENNLEVEAAGIHPDLFLRGDVIDFKCKEFYETDSSSLSLWCEAGGVWDDDFPVCIPKSPCSRPRIPANGRILEMDNNNETSFPIGFEINIECDDGFRIPSGVYGTRCIGTKWQQKISDCLPITCSDPEIPRNGMRSGDSFLHGSKMIFACMPGFTLIGDSERVCQKNGRWSGHTTVCDAGDSTCPDPGVPQNSYRKGNSFNAGDVVVYGCRHGATLFGNGTRVCLANGHWSGEQITCLGRNEFSDDIDVVTSLDMTMTIAARSAKESPISVSLARSGGFVKDDAYPVTFYFLVDTSGSITKNEFTKCKDFIKMILEKVGISKSESGIRASVTTFSSKPKVIFLPRERETTAAIRFVKGMVNDAKGTNINLVLEMLDGLLISQFQDIRRRTSKTIIFLMSDGKITEGGEPYELAATIRSYETVELYGIAVGQPDKAVLRNIICGVGAKCEKLIMLENHEKLLQLVNAAIGDKIDFSPCGLERPHYFSEEETNKRQKKVRRKRSVSADLFRISGGRQVQRPWPWLAALKAPNKEGEMKIQCGGAIIAEKWILTAAHCFRERKDKRVWLIVVGSTDLSLKSGIEFGVEEIIIHEDFSLDNLDFDIALVKLKDDIPYNFFIRPICLPPVYKELSNMSLMYKEKEIVTVAGWGHDEAYSINETIHLQDVDHLKETEFPIQKKQICSKPVPYKDCSSGECVDKTATPTKTSFCAGTGLGGDDACQGDSGGPLMQEVESKGESFEGPRWYAIGIVSWGVGCGQKGFYGYFAHVSKMRDWINNKTQVEFESFKP